MRKNTIFVILVCAGMLTIFFSGVNIVKAALHANDITVAGTVISIQDSQATGHIYVDIDDIKNDASVTSAMLWERSSGIWLCNYSIQTYEDTTLNLTSADGCDWLQLNGTRYMNIEGNLTVSDCMITGWNATAGANNTVYSTARAYIYIHGANAHYIFDNAIFGYLGYNSATKYGIVIDTINDATPSYTNDTSIIHNYIGIDYVNSEYQIFNGGESNNCKDAAIVFTNGADHGEINGVTYVNDSLGDGIRVTASENCTFDNLKEDNAMDDGIPCYQAHNTTITNSNFDNNGGDGIILDDSNYCIVTSGTEADDNTNGLTLSTTASGSHYNEISAFHPSGNAYGINIETDCTNNTFISCHPTGDMSGFSIAGNYNNFTTCRPNNNFFLGFVIFEGAYNEFHACNAHNNTCGYWFVGADNNHVNDSWANDNFDYGIKIQDGPFSNPANLNSINNVTILRSGIHGVYIIENSSNNTIIYSTINDNTEDGVRIDGAYHYLNYVYESDIFNNLQYGVAIVNGAHAYIFNCIVDNPTTQYCDYYVDDGSDADIYSPYILGFDKNINYQFDTVDPYGEVNHMNGDGDWELNTSNMKIYCNDGKHAYIDLTVWTSRIQWTATATTGTKIYQKIGGLEVGKRYDLLLDGDVVSTVRAKAGIMLPTIGSTGYVWFNHSGGWSSHRFTIQNHKAISLSEGEGTTTEPGAGEAETTTTKLLNQPTVNYAFIYIAIVIIVLAAVFLYFYRKK
jgi:hypothetical protein